MTDRLTAIVCLGVALVSALATLLFIVCGLYARRRQSKSRASFKDNEDGWLVKLCRCRISLQSEITLQSPPGQDSDPQGKPERP